ncbi:MAG: hypothetical protein PHN84_04495 [Desulfuromonadaceae bacterium]|nr:hypothetical protein [Desulfuromonadaceae bacterium]MDD2856836.1 hypothetical protein [Desulfuromonadaceae bacterium]
MKFEPRRITAILLLFVAISVIVMSLSESLICAGERPGAHEVLGISYDYDTQTPVPHDPSSSQSTDDHICLDGCGCPCHAPLINVSVVIRNSQPYTYLFSVEKACYIPEVYLSLFVPPDSSIV